MSAIESKPLWPSADNDKIVPPPMSLEKTVVEAAEPAAADAAPAAADPTPSAGEPKEPKPKAGSEGKAEQKEAAPPTPFL